MTLKRNDVLHGVSLKVRKYDRQSQSVLILVNHSLDWLGLAKFFWLSSLT